MTCQTLHIRRDLVANVYHPDSADEDPVVQFRVSRRGDLILTLDKPASVAVVEELRFYDHKRVLLAALEAAQKSQA